MGHGKEKKIKRGKRTKVWKILNGTYKKQTKLQKDVERLIQAIQQEVEWDETGHVEHKDRKRNNRLEWRC